MRQSLHAHVIYLENLIQDVRNHLTRPTLTIEEIEDLQLQLVSAESALEHYRQAYVLELSASGSEPPYHPASPTSNGETQSSGERNSEKRNRDSAAGKIRVRTRARTDWAAPRKSGLFPPAEKQSSSARPAQRLVRVNHVRG